MYTSSKKWISVAPCKLQSAMHIILLTADPLVPQEFKSREDAGRDTTFSKLREPYFSLRQRELWADSATSLMAPLLTLPLSFPGGDHRFMNNYTNSYTSEWSAPDTMKRYSMYLTPKGKGEYPALSWRNSARIPLGGVTVLSLPGIVLACTCCPSVIINRAFSHSHKHPDLNNKLSGTLLIRGSFPL